MSEDDPTTHELRVEQDHLAVREAREAQRADTDAETRVHERRADKAAYLAERLAEAEASERAADDA